MTRREALLLALLSFASPSVLAGMQEDRLAFIKKLIRMGVFQKVEIPGNLPQVWVTPTFHSLDFDRKSQFINVVYAYYVTMNPSYNIVVLRDSKTGKRIGKYAEVYGGLRMD